MTRMWTTTFLATEKISSSWILSRIIRAFSTKNVCNAKSLPSKQSPPIDLTIFHIVILIIIYLFVREMLGGLAEDTHVRQIQYANDFLPHAGVQHISKKNWEKVTWTSCWSPRNRVGSDRSTGRVSGLLGPDHWAQTTGLTDNWARDYWARDYWAQGQLGSWATGLVSIGLRTTGLRTLP